MTKYLKYIGIIFVIALVTCLLTLGKTEQKSQTITLGADSGADSPGTMADDDAVGTVEWINPDNAKTSNDTYTTATNSSIEYDDSSSNYLKATNFGFSIPSGATIDGIKVEVEMKANYENDPLSVNASYYNRIKLIKGGVISGDPENGDSPYFFPTTEAYKIFGGDSSLWGNSFSYSDINSSDFGVSILTSLSTNNAYNETSYTIIASIDHIRITVYYTEATVATLTGIQTIQGLSTITL